ncbi:hypothetical protein PAJ34TS1_64210 [Paenibacillus azoreducens]|uniref:Uncharacterized protein n=1 Tax=Paenibacillus azoreducens TaxID=116718 RepID=A0A919YHX2_9BACL|nr:hypothetical protein J34TS1_58290 [Paenibacillus azoreducens]
MEETKGDSSEIPGRGSHVRVDTVRGQGGNPALFEIYIFLSPRKVFGISIEA